MDNNPTIIMELKNYMEDIVFEMIDKLVSPKDQCTCDTCRYDIAAMALNDLKPHYVVSSIGGVYTKTNILITQFEVDIVRAITMAAVTVKEKPKH